MKEKKLQARETGLDHTLDVIREGYLFIQNRRKSFQSDVFTTKILGKRTICLSGKEAAKLFYNETYFKRNGAAPRRAVKTIFGEKAVQTLDDLQHRHRKNMLMSIMTDENLNRLEDIAQLSWLKAASVWDTKYQIRLYDETKPLLFKIACDWAGIPYKNINIKQKAKHISYLFESPAKFGLQYRRGRSARKKLNKWTQELIIKTRNNQIKPNKNSALYIIANHKDLANKPLNSRIAAVELINIIRPIVAVSIYINFIALSLIQYPHEHKKLQSGTETTIINFIQEVRRFYPFFPFLAAKVRQTFSWKNIKFKKGTLTLLDIYGTNHDTNLWENSDVFDSERFEKWDQNAYSLIPQGGGDYWKDHRCPGEWITLILMKVATQFLANEMQYNVPNQDLSYSMVKIPSIPKNKIILNNVKLSKE